jgi:hypothetical protein
LLEVYRENTPPHPDPLPPEGGERALFSCAGVNRYIEAVHERLDEDWDCTF